MKDRDPPKQFDNCRPSTPVQQVNQAPGLKQPMFPLEGRSFSAPPHRLGQQEEHYVAGEGCASREQPGRVAPLRHTPPRLHPFTFAVLSLAVAALRQSCVASGEGIGQAMTGRRRVE
jgi:hypothetical protein